MIEKLQPLIDAAANWINAQAAYVHAQAYNIYVNTWIGAPIILVPLALISIAVLIVSIILAFVRLDEGRWPWEKK